MKELTDEQQDEVVKSISDAMFNAKRKDSKQVVKKILSSYPDHQMYVNYSPYVDNFQYYCSCINKKTTKVTKYKAKKDIVFWTDKDGDIVLLEIDQLFDEAKEQL